MSDMLVFDDDATAENALAEIDIIAEYPKAGYNASTGEPEPTVTTNTWDAIQHKADDGKPYFSKPPVNDVFPEEAVNVVIDYHQPTVLPFGPAWVPEEDE